MEIDKELVGSRIKMLRSEKGMTQEEFGALISDAHKSLVSKWEKGQSLPNNERIKKIAELGNITVDELLYGPKQEIARKAIDDALDEYITTSSEFYHDYMDNQERYLQIINNLYEKYMDVDTIAILHFDDSYSILKDQIYGVFEDEFMKGDRTRENMLDYFINLLEDTLNNMSIYQQDDLTQEAVKNGMISEKEMMELQDKVAKVHKEFMDIANE